MPAREIHRTELDRHGTRRVGKKIAPIDNNRMNGINRKRELGQFATEDTV